MSGITNTSGTFNQAAAHDTSLYDPTIHDNQIVALYETDAQARSAQQTLVSAGFPATSMQIVARDSGAATSGTTGVADEGLWGSIKSLFVPDEDRTTYNTAVARGHAMLVVTPTNSMDRQHLIHTLESTDPLDFDAKLEEWRQSGYDTTGSATGASTSNTATAGHAVDAGMNTGYATGAAAATGATAMGLAGQPNSTSMATTGTVAPVAPAAMTGGAAATTGDTDTLKVMEERLRVGKREVAAGAVRIRSYIVERPVEEQVTLHQERVGIERHAVDRPATAADFAAFEERTIEARATSEEAVVGKEARVVEEIGLKKEAVDRVETVRDTVRRTEVEIEDPIKDAGTLGGTTSTTTGVNPNSTPGAITSGANSPRK